MGSEWRALRPSTEEDRQLITYGGMGLRGEGDLQVSGSQKPQFRGRENRREWGQGEAGRVHAQTACALGRWEGLTVALRDQDRERRVSRRFTNLLHSIRYHSSHHRAIPQSSSPRLLGSPSFQKLWTPSELSALLHPESTPTAHPWINWSMAFVSNFPRTS